MGALDWLRGNTVADMPPGETDQLREALRTEQDENLRLEESLLELALEDVGWLRLTAQVEQEFTRDGLRRMAQLCRIMAVANPLVKRGLNLRAYYVWGSGVQVAGRATGPTRDNQAAQDVNAVVQAFLDDEGNRAALTGSQAREENERALGTDGQVFLALWTRPATGLVQVRVLPFDEIVDVITNPDDSQDVWFYRRSWTATVVDPLTGAIERRQQEKLYPALGYRPAGAGVLPRDRVQWDAPVLHVRVNGQRGWTYGVPDAYAALDWARAYRDFLEDWAKLVKSLSRFAWRATAAGSKTRRQAVAAKLREAPSSNSLTGDPNDVGATAVTSPNVNLEAIPKSGATIDSESGRPLAGMVAAALDVPVTMLLADPGVTGARATAETLDRPTELMAQARRAVWSDALRRILSHVVDSAVRAPRGPLRGTVDRDPVTTVETVVLAGDTDRTVDISWPDLDEVDVEKAMKALEAADRIGKTPPLVIARLILELLGVDDVDEVLEQLVDEETGEFRDPDASAGDVAVQRFRRGDDPAAVVGDGAPPVDEPTD